MKDIEAEPTQAKRKPCPEGALLRRTPIITFAELWWSSVSRGFHDGTRAVGPENRMIDEARANVREWQEGRNPNLIDRPSQFVPANRIIRFCRFLLDMLDAMRCTPLIYTPNPIASPPRSPNIPLSIFSHSCLRSRIALSSSSATRSSASALRDASDATTWFVSRTEVRRARHRPICQAIR